MAIITPSANISEIRGSVGQQTFSRNHWRPYVKARTSPVQPDTQPQLDARAFMTEVSQAWQTLSPGERLAWQTFAQDQNTRSRLSSSHKMTGFNCYCRYAIYLSRNLCNYLTEPLPEQQLSNFFIYDISISTGGINTSFNLDASSGQFGMQMWYSDAISPGIESFNSVSFRSMDTFILSSGFNLPNYKNSWELVFSKLLSAQSGKKIFGMMKVIDPNNGVPQTIYRFSSIL